MWELQPHPGPWEEGGEVTQVPKAREGLSPACEEAASDTPSEGPASPGW